MMDELQQLLFNRAEWMRDAACRGKQELFKPVGSYKDEAFATCNACPVQQECLQYALDNDEPTGLWGGLTTKERKQLLGKSTANARN